MSLYFFIWYFIDFQEKEKEESIRKICPVTGDVVFA